MKPLKLIAVILGVGFLIYSFSGKNNDVSFTIPENWTKVKVPSYRGTKTKIAIKHNSGDAYVVVIEQKDSGDRFSDKPNRLEHLTKLVAEKTDQNAKLIDWGMTNFAGKDVGEVINQDAQYKGFSGKGSEVRTILYDPGPSNNFLYIIFSYKPELLSHIQDDFDRIEKSWKWKP